MQEISPAEIEFALSAVNNMAASDSERIEMLVELAMMLQTRARSTDHLLLALKLYGQAEDLTQKEELILLARIRARKATLLHMMPSNELANLLSALSILQEVLPIIEKHGNPEEAAEIHLNLGLVIQELAANNKAVISDAIVHYQAALRSFSKESYPVEFAIIQNNLATAYLAVPVSDERASMCEALAIQSLQAALQVVTIESDPVEYGMLQNNLGNALQQVDRTGSVEKKLRALRAYDEALKVRSRQADPLSYANTLANKANCLCDLPDNPEFPEGGNKVRVAEAVELYRESLEIFERYGEQAKTEIIMQALQTVQGETDERR